MPVHGLHHINYRAPAAGLRKIRDFYCEVLGLIEGPRPPFRVDGYWLYADGAPIVHLVEISAGGARVESEQQPGLDHVALRCSDLDAMLGRLRSAGIEHRVTQVPATADTQVFCRDPTGLGVELNFPPTL